METGKNTLQYIYLMDLWRHNCVTLQRSLHRVTSCVVIIQRNGIWEYVEFEKKKILTKTCRNLKDFCRRFTEEYDNNGWKDKQWTTFCESCTQPVWSNALQEAVGHGHPKLQIPLPQLKTQLSWICKFYAYSVEFSLVHKMQQSTKEYGSYIEK